MQHKGKRERERERERERVKERQLKSSCPTSGKIIMIGSSTFTFDAKMKVNTHKLSHVQKKRGNMLLENNKLRHKKLQFFRRSTQYKQKQYNERSADVAM